MTKTRRSYKTFGASSMMMGAGVFLAFALASFVGPQASQAVDETPTPVGVNISVDVIAVPPPPTVSAIIPVGAAADTAQVEVIVSGLLPYSYFELYLYSTPKLVASGFADSTGTFKVTITLPTTLETGTHSLEVKATDAGGQPYTRTISQFAVTADRRLAGAGPGSSLISTTVTSGTSSNGDGAVSSSTQTTETDADAAAAALGPDPFDLGGILYIGGVNVSTVPTPSLRGGTLVLAMTMKNVSNTTFDSSMDFWVTSPLSDTIVRLDQISVAGLAPGETRTVQATLVHVGQWPVMVAHATLRPPAAVENSELTPLTRESITWMWPLFGLMMFALFVAGFVLWRYLPVMGRAGRVERAIERDNAETLADAAAIVRAEAEIVTAQVALVEHTIVVAEAERPPAPEAPAVPKKPRTPRVPKPVVESGEANSAQPAAAQTPAVKKPAARKPSVKKPAVETDATTPKKPRAPRAPKINPAPEKPATETSAPESVEGDA